MEHEHGGRPADHATVGTGADDRFPDRVVLALERRGDRAAESGRRVARRSPRVGGSLRSGAVEISARRSGPAVAPEHNGAAVSARAHLMPGRGSGRPGGLGMVRGAQSRSPELSVGGSDRVGGADGRVLIPGPRASPPGVLRV